MLLTNNEFNQLTEVERMGYAKRLTERIVPFGNSTWKTENPATLGDQISFHLLFKHEKKMDAHVALYLPNETNTDPRITVTTPNLSEDEQLRFCGLVTKQSHENFVEGFIKDALNDIAREPENTEIKPRFRKLKVMEVDFSMFTEDQSQCNIGVIMAGQHNRASDYLIFAQRDDKFSALKDFDAAASAHGSGVITLNGNKNYSSFSEMVNDFQHGKISSAPFGIFHGKKADESFAIFEQKGNLFLEYMKDGAYSYYNFEDYAKSKKDANIFYEMSEEKIVYSVIKHELTVNGQLVPWDAIEHGRESLKEWIQKAEVAGGKKIESQTAHGLIDGLWHNLNENQMTTARCENMIFANANSIAEKIAANNNSLFNNATPIEKYSPGNNTKKFEDRDSRDF